MTFFLHPSTPKEYGPCLVQVEHKAGKDWVVMFYHPRKGWVFREGLALSPSHRVIKWTEIKE